MTPPEGKNTALLAYIPFVGFLIAFTVNSDDKHHFATWHTKNMFGIFILYFVALVFQSNNVYYTRGDIIWVIATVLWIYSFIMAYRNNEKGVPFLGDKFQKWFKFLN